MTTPVPTFTVMVLPSFSLRVISPVKAATVVWPDTPSTVTETRGEAETKGDALAGPVLPLAMP